MTIKKSVKNKIEELLCRWPVFYSSLLGRKKASGLEKRIFLRLIRRGDVVVEAGANRGYFTRMFAYVVRRGGAVHAFEPVPPTFDRLRMTLVDVPAEVLHLNLCGLADQAGSASFLMPGSDDGQASMRKQNGGSWLLAEEIMQYQCEITTLDQYVNLARLQRLDFIKFDIEGAEWHALRGGRETLQRFHPLIALEVCAGWLESFGASPTKVIDELLNAGYGFFWVLESGRFSKMHTAQKPGDLLAHCPESSFNLLACHDKDRAKSIGDLLASLRHEN